MYSLSPGYAFFFTMLSAAIFALSINLLITKQHKIANPIFSLARALASFISTWLLWGAVHGENNGETAITHIGLLQYLALQHTRVPEQQWLSQPVISWPHLGMTIVLTAGAIFILSFILSRLGAISDRQR